MLHDIISHLDWSEILIAGVTGVGGLLWAWLRKRWPKWRLFWHELLEGIRSIGEIRKDIKGIKYYVAPNGGGSLMDAAKRTETKMTEIKDQIDLLTQTFYAESDADDDLGRFHCNPAGENTYVNTLYARWLGVGKAELMGWGYLNFIHPDDVDRVRKQWEECRREHRQYRLRHRMVAGDGDIFTVEVIATPIPETLPIKRWIGTIRRITLEPRTDGNKSN